MFICKPERSVFQTRLILFTGVIVTLILFYLPLRIPQYAGIIRFCAVGALTVAILLIVRYSITEFEYSVGNGDFSVTKIVGNKRTVICSIALESAIDIVSKRDYDHLPSKEKGYFKYSLNQNLVAESFVFLCNFNGRRAMVEFEPNNEFVAIMKDEIAKAKKDA